MSEELRTQIGVRLKEERARLSLNQAEFAALGQVSKRAQIEWEKGTAVPNAAFLALAAHAGVDVLYVVTGQRVPIASGMLTPDEAELLDCYRASDAEGKVAARKLVFALARLNAE